MRSDRRPFGVLPDVGELQGICNSRHRTSVYSPLGFAVIYRRNNQHHRCLPALLFLSLILPGGLLKEDARPEANSAPNTHARIVLLETP